MSNGKIIYIDMFYPNKSKGETFLASEINCSDLQGVDKFIYPIWAASEKDEIDLPGFKVIHSPKRYDKITKARYAIAAATKTQTWLEIEELCKSRRMTIKNIETALSFEADCQYFSRVLSDFIKENIEKGAKIVLYSYWLHWSAYTAVLTAKKLGNEFDFTVISRAHRFDVYEYAAKGNYIPCRKVLLKNIDYIYPISTDAMKYLSHYGLNPNMKIFRLGTFDKGVHISPLSNTLNILSCSWMRKVKRLDLICDALKNVQFDVIWTHIGSGEEEEHIKELSSTIDNPHVSYRFLGAMKNSEVMEYFVKESVDVFINVSASEGVPVSVMEAMSFGKPVIATDVGGTAEVIDDGVTGYLLDEDCSADDLVKCLAKLRELSPVEYKEMCSCARAKWAEICDADKQYKEFYDTVKLMF